MIPRPADHGWRLDADGILIEPEGAGYVMRYRERVRPLRRWHGLLALHRPAGVAVLAAGAPIRTATDEGEHALLGEERTSAGLRVVGVVLMDDFASMLEGWTADPAQEEPLRAQVASLLRRDTHLAGARRRRFYYDPPPGWQGCLLGAFHAHWFPADHPRDPRTLVVPPAVPLRAAGLEVQDVLAALLDGAPPPRARKERVAHASLSGSAWWVETPGAQVRVVILDDGSYAYPAVWRAPTRAEDPDFAAVLRSIRPIPTRASQAEGRGLFMPWSE